MQKSILIAFILLLTSGNVADSSLSNRKKKRQKRLKRKPQQSRFVMYQLILRVLMNVASLTGLRQAE